MEIKDLYLDQNAIIESFNFKPEELEMFVMAMIYGKELKNFPYHYIKELNVFRAQKVWNKIQNALSYSYSILNGINSCITEDGHLNLYTKESFLVLSKIMECRCRKERGRDYKLNEFYEKLLSLIKEDSPIKIATAESCYNYSDFMFEGVRYSYTFETEENFFCREYNEYFNDLFVEYEKVDYATDDDKDKYENWQERMKKYEEVKDMVDHAPKKPEINCVYNRYIRPTKYCLELIETYKKLILAENVVEPENSVRLVSNEELEELLSTDEDEHGPDGLRPLTGEETQECTKKAKRE